MPVSEWLIAKEPVPLSVDAVTDRHVSENRAGCVISVKTGDAIFIGPVTIAGTSYGRVSTSIIGMWGPKTHIQVDKCS